MLRDCLPLEAIDRLTPEVSADFLKLTSREEFVGFMRRTLPPKESKALTDAELYALHDAMCERLEEKASKGLGSLETSGPAGQA